MTPKIKKITTSSITIVILAIIMFIVLFIISFPKGHVDWGVTFSPSYAQDELGLDWQETYLAILDDLKVSHIRLSAYWNQIEPKPGQYNFSDLDWQIEEAVSRDVKIILGVGRRLPRWPECHDPVWIKNLPKNEIHQHQLALVETIVRRYEDNDNIIIWQVENEPYLEIFGECPPLDKTFLDQEIALVRSLNPKPIMLTDSGELSGWLRIGRHDKDIIGTTLYRVVYNNKTGYWHYPLSASYYYFKSLFNQKVFGTKEVIVAELQTEAWHTDGKNLTEMALEEQYKSLSPEQFKENVSFSRKAGFGTVYLWGAEWWYYLKTERDTDDFWLEAKKLWQN